MDRGPTAEALYRCARVDDLGRVDADQADSLDGASSKLNIDRIAIDNANNRGDALRRLRDGCGRQGGEQRDHGKEQAHADEVPSSEPRD
jgi:hypothetical protein